MKRALVNPVAHPAFTEQGKPPSWYFQHMVKALLAMADEIDEDGDPCFNFDWYAGFKEYWCQLFSVQIEAITLPTTDEVVGISPKLCLSPHMRRSYQTSEKNDTYQIGYEEGWLFGIQNLSGESLMNCDYHITANRKIAIGIPIRDIGGPYMRIPIVRENLYMLKSQAHFSVDWHMGLHEGWLGKRKD